MTAVNAVGRRSAIGLVAKNNGILNMSPINGASRRPGVGLAAAAAAALKNSAMNAIRREPGVGVISITQEIFQAPFAFASVQAERPAGLGRDYLVDAGVLFLATTLLGGLAALISPDHTLLVAQSVLIGVVVLALLAGTGVALAFARFGDSYVDTRELVSGAQYGAGFGLVLLSVFKLVGLVGPALVPNYSGSVYEALTVLGGMGVVLFAAFLMLDWPRRIARLDEGAYYTGVGGLFLAFGLLLKVTGIA